VGAASAGGVSQNGVVLSGMVDPQGLQTFYEFDLGVDTSYGTRVFGDAGAGVGGVPVSASFQGLAAGTTYHYRLVATDVYGAAYGPDQTFTTPAYPTATLTAPLTPVLVSVPTVVFPAGEAVAASSTRARKASRKHVRGRATRKSVKRGRGGHRHGGKRRGK
jgi:hypothetical protein